MSYLLRNRIIFVGARIDDQVGGSKWCQQCIIVHIYHIYHTLCTLKMGSCACPQLATQTVAQILALEAIDPTADIKLYINSAGPVRHTRHEPCVCLPLASLVAPLAIMDQPSLHTSPCFRVQVGHHMQWWACSIRSGPSSRRSAQWPWATAPAQPPSSWWVLSPIQSAGSSISLLPCHEVKCLGPGTPPNEGSGTSYKRDAVSVGLGNRW